MRVIFFYLFFLITIIASAQQNKTISIDFNKTPLKTILTTLESNFNVHFSYKITDVTPQTLTFSVKNKSLKSVLKTLNTKTGLLFEMLSDKFIAIRTINYDDLITVCGIVKSNNGIPLEGASILYNKLGIITNKQGYFKIESVKANTSIQFHFLGYMPKEIEAKTLYQTPCDTIVLEEKSEQIEAVVIKNYLTNGIDKTSSGAYKISPQKIGILAGLTEPDLFQSIQLLPGVSSPNETATGLHVRGGTPDENVILWDGIKIYHSGHLFGAISPFNPYITKEIDFINKGTDAKFGEGVSSILNIKTNDSIQSKINVGGGMNLISADAYVKIPVIKNVFSVSGSARRSFTDLYQTNTYHETSDIIFKTAQPSTLLNSNNNFFFLDYNVKGVLKLKNNNYFNVSFLQIENKLDFGLLPLDGSSSSDDKKLSYHNYLETDNHGFSLNWAKIWSPKFKNQISTYYSDYYLLYNKFETEDTLRNLTFAKKNTVKDFGFKYNTELKLNKSNTLNTGYQFSNKNVSYLFYNKDNSNQIFEDTKVSDLNTHVFYSTFTSQKNNHYYLNTGVRLNYYQNLNRIFVEPRFNFGQYLNDNFRLNLTAEFKTQALSQIDETNENALSLENKLWSIADNKKFPIIQANQFTLGFSYVKNHWQFDLDTYVKRIKGIATLNFGFSDIVDNDVHIGESEIKGFDIYLKKGFKNYDTWISYTFDNTKNKFSDINNGNYFTGNNNIKHNFYWSNTYRWKRFNFALGWRWHSGKPYSKATSIYTNSHGTLSLQTNGVNNYNLPDYNRLDFSTSYQFSLSKTKPIQAKIGISYLNVINHQNLLSRDYYINQSTNQINVADKVSLERVFNLVFRVNY